ncbi:MAG TPA: hypothetical protein VNF26_14190 [Candidatus Baltobacterales bacterium]|nr:hypothetical protein [Candidatus Baltobacterales bacterium]
MLEELHAEFDSRAERDLQQALERTGLLLLGEVHGVAENAAVIYALFVRFGFRALALEWPADVDLKATHRSEDGRVTREYFTLLRTLQAEESLEQLILFDDPGDGTWGGRDAAMAARLLAALQPGVPTLAVMGNLHSRTRSHRHGEPLGLHVARARPGVPEARITYVGGGFYNFGTKRFRHWPLRRLRKPRFRRAGQLFVFELPTATPASD